jgi:hypothetical protein
VPWSHHEICFLTFPSLALNHQTCNFHSCEISTLDMSLILVEPDIAFTLLVHQCQCMMINNMMKVFRVCWCFDLIVCVHAML